MISLYITHIGFLISTHAPAEAFVTLRMHGYLSEKALMTPVEVITLIQQVADGYSSDPPTGHELWRAIDEALESAGYLSLRGLVDGRRSVTRSGETPPP